LLIIDEMTLGIHVSLHAQLFAAIKEIAAHGTAILLVDESTANALEVVQYCYLLRSGVVADHGPPQRFRDNELLTAGYVGN
jgi:ABC-type branched-subunit amino acid transport system ATPase component